MTDRTAMEWQIAAARLAIEQYKATGMTFGLVGHTSWALDRLEEALHALLKTAYEVTWNDYDKGEGYYRCNYCDNGAVDGEPKHEEWCPIPKLVGSQEEAAAAWMAYLRDKGVVPPLREGEA